MKSHKQYAGVWFDSEKAIIISNDHENDSSDYSIHHIVKAAEAHGGGSELSINNARHSEMLKYYKSVSTLLQKYDELFIFGPGKAQEHLQNHLHEDPQFKKKLITIDSADHLTDPQMIARVRDFFKLHQS